MTPTPEFWEERVKALSEQYQRQLVEFQQAQAKLLQVEGALAYVQQELAGAKAKAEEETTNEPDHG